MKNPYLYHIGIRNECFSQKMFAGYLLYGLWYAFVIYATVYSVDCAVGETLSDGKATGLWVAGNTVYGVCVIVANLILAHRLSTVDGVSIALYAFSIGSYFLSLYL